MKSEGSTDVGAQLHLKRSESSDGGWEIQAAAMIINSLLRIINSGGAPAEVHVDASRLDQVRAMTLSDKVGQIVPPGDPNERNVALIAQWWDENREKLQFVPREGILYPYVISAAEQAEAAVFATVFQQLQMKGLEKALLQMGLDLQTLMQAPKLLHDTVWFQFQLMLHDRMKSGIITPQEMPLFKA